MACLDGLRGRLSENNPTVYISGSSASYASATPAPRINCIADDAAVRRHSGMGSVFGPVFASVTPVTNCFNSECSGGYCEGRDLCSMDHFFANVGLYLTLLCFEKSSTYKHVASMCIAHVRRAHQ